jgi:alanyl-tRNA synthetase
VASGAMALFGEKYGERVRVIGMGGALGESGGEAAVNFSTELCGGTHVARTGDIGLFKIISESGVAAGVRRVEGVSGEGALTYVQSRLAELEQVAAEVHAAPAEVTARVVQIMDGARALEKEVARLKSKLAASHGDELISQAVTLPGPDGDSVRVLAAVLEGADAKGLRETLDQLKSKLAPAAIVLAAVADGSVQLIAGVTSDLVARLKAGELVNAVAQQVGGKGGGRADMAQAGGSEPDKLPAALASVPDWVKDRLWR